MAEKSSWQILLKTPQCQQPSRKVQLQQFMLLIHRQGKSFETFIQRQREQCFEEDMEELEELEQPHVNTSQRKLKMMCSLVSRPCERCTLSL
eukprot:Skav236573  [mRNA]  locus=scaffold2180:168170:168445:+ [translate_table: standard]